MAGKAPLKSSKGHIDHSVLIVPLPFHPNQIQWTILIASLPLPPSSLCPLFGFSNCLLVLVGARNQRCVSKLDEREMLAAN